LTFQAGSNRFKIIADVMASENNLPMKLAAPLAEISDSSAIDRNRPRMKIV
jgi:hypothetical protein